MFPAEPPTAPKSNGADDDPGVDSVKQTRTKKSTPAAEPRKGYPRQRPQISYEMDFDDRIVPLRSHGSGMQVAVVIEAVLRSPATKALAELMPDARLPGPSGGKPSVYPPVVHLLVFALATDTGTVVSAIRELRYTEHWKRVCDLLEEHWGEDVSEMRECPVTRRATEGYVHRRLDIPLVERLAETHSREAMALVGELGNFVEDEPNYLTPGLTDLLVGDVVCLSVPSTARQGTVLDGDGKEIDGVINSQSSRRPRIIADANPHVTGDKRSVIGRNYQAFHALLPNARIVTVSVRYLAPGVRTESQGAVEVVRELNAYAGGRVSAVAYDGALQGEAHVQLANDGIIVVNLPAHAKKDQLLAASGIADNNTKYRSALKVPPATHDLADGQLCEHRIVAHDSRFCEVLDGKLKPLPITAVESRPLLVQGSAAFELEIEVPCALDPSGSFRRRYPHDMKVGDRLLAQVIRVIDTGTDTFKGTYGHRSAAESFFAWLQRKFLNGRSRHDHVNAEYFDFVAAAVLNYAQVWLEHVDLAAKPDPT